MKDPAVVRKLIRGTYQRYQPAQSAHTVIIDHQRVSQYKSNSLNLFASVVFTQFSSLSLSHEESASTHGSPHSGWCAVHQSIVI